MIQKDKVANQKYCSGIVENSQYLVVTYDKF